MLFIVVCAAANTLQAQEAANVHISINTALAPGRIRVEGEQARGSASSWSFLDSYAGVVGLGERIENLRLADQSGAGVPIRRLTPGTYQAASAGATQFSYEVRAAPLVAPKDAAHVSWLTNERGMLALGDLLPRSFTKVNVRFTLPAKWSVAGLEKSKDGKFETENADDAVFFVGEDLREQRESIGSMDTALIVAGDWSFTDEDATKTVVSILKDHKKTMGGVPRKRSMIILSPFPHTTAQAQQWSAEARGGTVIILADRSSSATAGLALLSFPLAHELFHLWVPNGLAFDGNYDWFYEGFTLYQAVRAAMRLQLLTFEDYLAAFGRAFDGYVAAQDSGKLSLLDASRQRWSGTAPLVYNKGMLVAFLYDLSLRQQTKGKHSLGDVYHELFRQRSGVQQQRADGNATVLATLSRAGGADGTDSMKEFTHHYVERASAIDLALVVAPFGLKVERGKLGTRVTVAEKLTGEQRSLLRRFGYNELANAKRR